MTKILSEVKRLNMWSGPRNISTALMRSFENRRDTQVIDEPFYAAFLARTGLEHPMREVILAAQPVDPVQVVAGFQCAQSRPILYLKQMAHHMLDDFDVDWALAMKNAFLIRAPEAVLASYQQKHREVDLNAIGLSQQWALFERIADHQGVAPMVLDAQDILTDPYGRLSELCAYFGIAFDSAMLSWPQGKRDSDGVWAPAWYEAVEKSTGFQPVRPELSFAALADDLKPLAEKARPIYERLSAYRVAA